MHTPRAQPLHSSLAYLRPSSNSRHVGRCNNKLHVLAEESQTIHVHVGDDNDELMYAEDECDQDSNEASWQCGEKFFSLESLVTVFLETHGRYTSSLQY